MKSDFRAESLQKDQFGNFQEPIEVAVQAFENWRTVSAEGRSSILVEAANILRKNAEEIAAIISAEMGKPIRESRGEVEYAAKYFSWFAAEAERMYGRTYSINDNKEIIIKKYPIGVCGLITPWNFPLAMLARKVAAALAAGCTVIAKPAPETPTTAYALKKVLEDAKLPSGVINVVSGDAETIVSYWMKDERVRKISFTGSAEVGKLLMEQGAPTLKRLTLELGGNAPCIIFDDCDLEKTLSSVMNGKFRNCGQTCVSINRFLIEENFCKTFLSRYVEKVAALRCGEWSDETTEIGSLVSFEAVRKIKRLLEDAVGKGAKIIYGEMPSGKSLKVLPVVVTDVNSSMAIVSEEIFGPVSVIIKFKDDDEAVRLANDTSAGLAAYVFTKSLDRYQKLLPELQFGMIGFNESNISEVSAPFGGIKQSGFGREGGAEGIEEYLRIQFTASGFSAG